MYIVGVQGKSTKFFVKIKISLPFFARFKISSPNILSSSFWKTPGPIFIPYIDESDIMFLSPKSYFKYYTEI